MTHLIKVKEICKIYGDLDDSDAVKTKAVCGVSFSIEQGEFIAIMGPSGSGKSTLMHLLGFLDRPTSGEYFLEGQNITKFSDDEIAKIRNEKIGFVFQMFNLMPKLNVMENVELPLLYSEKKVFNRERHKRAKKALDSVGLSHRLGHFPNQLSGGEKQRVAIARSLINDPAIIFADEPTGNLDSKSGLQVMNILEGLNEKGRTIILVTHETYTAQHAKRIIKLKDGDLVSDEAVNHRRKVADGEVLK